MLTDFVEILKSLYMAAWLPDNDDIDKDSNTAGSGLPTGSNSRTPASRKRKPNRVQIVNGNDPVNNIIDQLTKKRRK